MKDMNLHIKKTSWDENSEPLSSVRRKVFIEEQQVPEALEWDEFDPVSIHILVTDDNDTPVATGRIKTDGHIGRMAVLKEHRNQGVGTAILQQLINYAIQQDLKKVYLHAQVSALTFYEKQGFKVYSDEFMDAGIPHKSMQLDLQALENSGI